MPLVLVKETGAGLTNANSYADKTEGNTYHDGHIYATNWTTATDATKEAALVMATRIIDSSYQFYGKRANDNQSLQWPRQYARDPDRLESPVPVTLTVWDEYFDSDAVPTLLKNATIETARTLIIEDRTADPDGEGLHQFALTGVLAISFNAKDRRPMIPHLALLMLAKLGDPLHELTGTAKLIRT
jgi:hypothetical protein